jgi:hypothetical protein
MWYIRQQMIDGSKHGDEGDQRVISEIRGHDTTAGESVFFVIHAGNVLCRPRPGRLLRGAGTALSTSALSTFADVFPRGRFRWLILAFCLPRRLGASRRVTA